MGASLILQFGFFFLLQVMTFLKSLCILLNDFVFYITTAKIFEMKQKSIPSVF